MAEPAPRQNSKGHPCPSWCTVDHGERVGSSQVGYHGTGHPPVHTSSGYVNASAYQDGFSDDAPQIALTCLAPGGALLVDLRDSDKLAAFVEQLADATPGQHRELAAAIRKAAAVIAFSSYTQRIVLDHFPEVKNRTVVIPPGLSPTLTRCTDYARLQAVRQRYTLPSSFLLFVGDLSYRKNRRRFHG